MDFRVNEYGEASATVPCPLFDHDVEVQILPAPDRDVVSASSLARVDDVARLGAEHRRVVADFLFEHAEVCFRDTSYGVVPEAGEDETDANRRAFGVRSPDDAFAAAGIPYAQVDGAHDALARRYVVLVFFPPWEDEHGCGMVLQDGVPVGWGSADVVVERFEDAPGP